MNQINYWRLLKYAVIGLACLLAVFVVALLIVGPSLDFTPLYVYGSNLSAGIQGRPEHCEHFVSIDHGIRITYTPYSFPQRFYNKHIDPNNWQQEIFSNEFMHYGAIVIPEFDYSVTRDGGVSWELFAQVANVPNRFPNCKSFDSLDPNNFWVWSNTWLAITYDGGSTWITPKLDVERWNRFGYMSIFNVTFNWHGKGRIVFRNETDRSPVLVSKDSGETWQLDPIWKATNEAT